MKKNNRIFRSVGYKSKIFLEKQIPFVTNKLKIISDTFNLLIKGSPEAARIVISRAFQKKKKFSKHKRFQFILNFSKILKKHSKDNSKGTFIKNINSVFKNTLQMYNKNYILQNVNSRKRNKRRMFFKPVFTVPFTVKGNKSRMGKGKAPVDRYLAKLTAKTPLFFLERISFLRAKKLKAKLNLKFGFPIKFIKY